MEEPMEFKADSASTLFTQACAAIYCSGKVSRPRNQKVMELNNMQLILTSPYNNVVKVGERKISLKYLIAEWLWYCSGRQDSIGADYIARFAPFWNKIRNKDGSLNSNYGFYFFEPMQYVIPADNPTYQYKHRSQFDYVCKKLIEDPDSRQAIATINNVQHKNGETLDFPCTVGMQFFIRDNKLDMTVMMRSTDLVLGFCNDIFQFSMFQSVVLNRLKYGYPELKMGTLTLFTSSLHVYERHFDMIAAVTRTNGKNLRELADIPFQHLEYEDFIAIMQNRITKKTIKANNYIMGVIGE